ncbi:CWF19-like protein 1 [Macrosteles quadrilineatus]|uniref:CWF19-like protein 1 n=1 Tax=Macrosteles quadrilineatus TaxID=74068 RepID=UPI0023E20391|nr:CWF19-like protein 1 [Macrosteles quadrilineatus]XP_054279006.1 CWF19-like protein 1 [Macrosteles quadrilineatus]
MAQKRNGNVKVLVCGDVNGKFKTLFSRVEKVNKKNGPFDLLLCVGNFFGPNTSEEEWNLYKTGKKSVPVYTNILGPNDEEQLRFYPEINGSELAPNISYLGRRGVFSVSEGLKVAYVSGTEGDRDAATRFTAADVVRVRDSCVKGQPSYRGVDVLLTSQWPQGVTQRDEKTDIRVPSGSELLSWLAVQIKPRYHFAGLEGIFYERPPYRNLDTGCDSGSHLTRFMALAPVGSDARWLYAASLTPIEVMSPMELRQQTTDQTELPYSGRALSAGLSGANDSGTQQFFYDMSAAKRPHDQDGNHREKRARPTFDQGSCWFCLASPQVEKHLVISIGREVYLALAKGGLVEDHLLILPVTHHQAAAHLPESVTEEIQQFQGALKKCFAKQGKVPVFFERNYKTSHLQIQVVPVPKDVVPKLKMVFQDCAEAEGFTVDELPPHARMDQVVQPNTPYFYVELPNGERLYHRVRKNFPLQFGREVLASSELLDMEDRADWRSCTASKEEETKTALDFRNVFKPFDFTL